MKLIASLAVFTALLVPVAPASAMTTEEFIAELQSLQAQLIAVQEQVAQLEATSDTEITSDGEVLGISTEGGEADTHTFSVFIDNTLFMNTDDYPSLTEAQLACEAIAFDVTHMWKEIRCEYDGETLYNDIFVAG